MSTLLLSGRTLLVNSLPGWANILKMSLLEDFFRKTKPKANIRFHHSADKKSKQKDLTNGLRKAFDE